MPVDYTGRMPPPAAPMVDPQTGAASVAFWHWMLAIFKRTGDGVGIAAVDVQTAADAAQATATAAAAAVVTEQGVRAAADTAEANTRAAADAAEATARMAADAAETAARIVAVAAEATTRAAADTTLTTAIATEATTRATADALLAPKANPAFTGTVDMPIFTNAVNDAAAAAAGVAVGQLYRNGSIVMLRIV